MNFWFLCLLPFAFFGLTICMVAIDDDNSRAVKIIAAVFAITNLGMIVASVLGMLGFRF